MTTPRCGVCRLPGHNAAGCPDQEARARETPAARRRRLGRERYRLNVLGWPLEEALAPSPAWPRGVRCGSCREAGHNALRCPARTGRPVEDRAAYNRRRAREYRRMYVYGWSEARAVGEPPQARRCSLCGQRAHTAPRCPLRLNQLGLPGVAEEKR